MIVPEHVDDTLIIEIDKGNFNIQKDKVVFIRQNSRVRFVASSTLNSIHTPFLITDKKIKTSSHKDSEFNVSKNITFQKQDFQHKYKLIPGKIEKNGYWVAEEVFKYVGPIFIQMIFCEVKENSYSVKQFGDQEYFIVEPENFKMDNLIMMTVLPRCIGRFEKWKLFFQKQISLGYNSFHLPPIQQLGMSRSYYSISNQHQLSSEIFNMPDKYQALQRFVKQFNKNGVTFFVDIVLNHTSNTSQWIKNDPDCVFTIHNTPILNSTLLVDCVIFDWGQKIKRGELQGFNKKQPQNQNDLNFLRQSLIMTLQKLNIWQYFQINQDVIEQMFKMVEPSPPSINIFMQDPSVQIQKIFNKNIVNLGTGRYQVGINNLKQDWQNAKIKYQKNDLVIARNNINKEWKDKVNGWIHSDIPDGVISQIKYKCLILKQKNQDHLPFVKRAFSLINLDNNTYALNNGWVGGYSSSHQDMIQSKQFYFLRRKVNIWGDLVKLRYGDSKHSSPKLWNHMKQYVKTMAKYFNGFRIDNCHNTPIHVGQYFIKKARQVNHSLIVFAELFTNSKQQDSIYIKKMGINALLKQVIHSLDSKRFVSSFYSNSGVNSNPLGALGRSFVKNGQKRTYVHPRRPEYLVYQLTHDNNTYVQKHIQSKQLPIMVLLSFLGSPIGTNKGFDQYYPEHIPVTQTTQIYQDDKPCQQKVFKNPKIKMIITYQDPVPSTSSKVQIAGTWTDWKPVKMNYNQKYYYIQAAVDGESYQFKFIVDGNWLSETRRPKIDIHGNHTVQLNYQSPRRTLYSNLEGVRSSLSVLKDKFNHYNQVYLKPIQGTVQILREDPQTKKRYIFVIGNLSDHIEFGKYKLIGSVSSAIIWVQKDGKITQSSSLKEFFDIQRDGKDTVLVSGPLPIGFSCVIETELSPDVVAAIQKLTQIVKQTFVFEQKLSVFDISTLMFSCSKQQQVIRGSANYVIPEQGQLPYGGLGSLYNILQESIRYDNLLIPLYSNIMQGDWLFNYILSRIQNKPQFKKLYDKMNETFQLLKNIPRHQIPYFFSQFICNIVNSLKQTLNSEIINIPKSSFSDNLVLASHQFFNQIPCPNLEYKSSMAAGLPHFTTGWARSWGRDTFISIQLLLLHPDICKQNILNFAKNLRHGLIPNLLDLGNNPRYNCRDAAWWFIRAVKEYANHTNDYGIFKQTVEMNFLNNDIDIDQEMKSKNIKIERSIEDIIQEIFQSHADGIQFREWRAGYQIDSSMTSDGFNIALSVDQETGFVIGGNGKNCLTWMDKMGSVGKTKGIPSTSRNGSPVELVGLLYHVLIAYDQLNKKGAYSYNSVQFRKKAFKYSEWADYIKLHFEEWFWIPTDLKQKTHPSIEDRYIKRRGIYKDVIKSCNLPQEEYRLRPNALITLALSPQIVKPEHALEYLKNVENSLIKSNSIGIGTLDKIHQSLYSQEYDNDLDSPEWKKAYGFSYHNGPEWIWLYGFYVKALLNFRQITPQRATALLQNHIAYIRRDIWMSLPELTNTNGRYNKFSCSAQAWSISSILLALKSISEIKENDRNI